ncbi:MAG TPA: hypothetical protein VMJ10_19105 [Kofleriaceae bacterium]|nr:hypothetical protein [Kofleriaceae bacterium]
MSTRIAVVIAFAALAAAPALGKQQKPCAWELVVPQTQGAEGCWLDEQVTAAPGSLVVDCQGSAHPSGDARAIFGERTFTGKMTDGDVTVVLHTRFHYGDGCDWGTTQTITGRPESGHLTYTYREFPLPGQHGCLNACAAQGDVRVR